MTAGRRLDSIEQTLTPTQRAIAWLEEAHSYGDMASHVRSLLDQPPSAFPLDRLCLVAAASARAATRGKPAEEADLAVRREVGETAFRYELAMGLNVAAHELIDRQGLIHLVIVGQVGILLLQQEHEPESVPRYLEQLVQIRDLAARRVDELLAHEAARAEVEARYLDGHPALFPAVARAWGERLHEIQLATVMADRLAELDGAAPGVIHHPDWVAARAAVLVRDFVEKAKVVALEKVDEPRQAFAIAGRWMRAMLAPAGASATCRGDGPGEPL